MFVTNKVLCCNMNIFCLRINIFKFEFILFICLLSYTRFMIQNIYLQTETMKQQNIQQ